MSNFILDAIAARKQHVPLTPEQIGAINAILAWVGPPGTKPSQQVFRLFGPAGTGKTTIMKELRARLPGRLVLYSAFTGKAASVLRDKGCDGAKTLHAFAMKPVSKIRAQSGCWLASSPTLIL